MAELMQMPITILLAVFTVYSVVAVGMFMRKYGLVDRNTSDTMVRIVVNIFMPCLIVSRVLSNEAFNDIRNVIFPPLTGIGIVLLGITVAWLYTRLLPGRVSGLLTRQQIGTFCGCIGMLNYGYVPIPLIDDLFPGNDRMSAVLFVQNVGVEFMLWTAVIFCFMGRINRETLKKMVNPPVLAIIGTMTLNLTGLDSYVPGLVRRTVDMIGIAAIPVSLLFVGAVIEEQMDLKAIAGDKLACLKIGFGSCLLRLIVLPALTILLVKYIPCTNELKTVLVVEGAMASAIFPIVMTRLYNGSTTTAIITVFTNSIPAILTTPFWIAFGLKYLELG